MKDACIRILRVDIQHFRNVNNGILSFSEYTDIIKGNFNNRPGILGLYGQNGSGKTAAIYAMNLLKNIILENKFDSDLYENIAIWSKTAKVKYTFFIYRFTERYLVEYEIFLLKNSESKTVELEHDKISIKSFNHEKGKWVSVIKNFEINYKNEEIEDFLSINNKNKIDDNKLIIKANVIKGICANDSTSFFFNTETFEIFKKICNIEKYKTLNKILNLFKVYASVNLIILDQKDSSLITSTDLIPLSVRLVNNQNDTYNISSGILPIKLFESQVVSIRDYDIIEQLVAEINIIMPTLLPNFKIKIVDLGFELLKDGNKGRKIEFVSVLNEYQIPLKNESEGTKKIIAICSALISVFNSETVCLCVDELDSGVFEYLLGQILKLFSLEAKGQIMFTSHNLRPLEVLPYEYIMLTTTNKDNRYIRPKNVKPTNNLRDFYIRGLQVGGQNEEIYNETDINEISRAFRKAGYIYNDTRNKENNSFFS